jgi:cysteine desulfurase
VLYFDHNATTPLRPEVRERMAEAVSAPGNPQSPHAAGQAARRLVERASASVRRLVGAPETWRVVHTGSGTEANALAVLGIGRQRARLGKTRVLVSAIEHPCVARAAAELGLTVDTLPVTALGQVDVEAARTRLRDDVALVAVMLANNETGVLQPVRELASMCAGLGVPLHTDAVQAAGKVTLDAQSLGVVSLAVAAHKLGGPKGAGALIIRQDAEILQLWGGGPQEHGLRPGTQAVPLCVGLGAAAELAVNGLAHVAAWRDELEGVLSKVPGTFVIGAGAPRLPNTSALGFSGHVARSVVLAASARGLMLGAGAACHGDEVKPSGVLLAMGVLPERAVEVVRLSLGFDTSAADVRAAGDILTQVVQRRAA